jgi:hypothetical protein
MGRRRPDPAARTTGERGLSTVKQGGCLRRILPVSAVEGVVDTPEIKKHKIVRKTKNIFEIAIYKAEKGIN